MHARCNARVALTTEQNVVILAVTDDGSGFDTKAPARGIGLHQHGGARRRGWRGVRDQRALPAGATTVRLLAPTVRAAVGHHRRNTLIGIGFLTVAIRAHAQQRILAARAMGRRDHLRQRCRPSISARLVEAGPMSVIRVVLVDDHRVVTTSLKAYLESFPDLRVVGVAASGEELLEHVERWTPDVVLQDLLLPGGIDGIETTRRVLAKGLPLRVIALTALDRRGSHDGRAPGRSRRIRPQGRRTRNAAGRGPRRGGRPDVHRSNRQPAPGVEPIQEHGLVRLGRRRSHATRGGRPPAPAILGHVRIARSPRHSTSETRRSRPTSAGSSRNCRSRTAPRRSFRRSSRDL